MPAPRSPFLALGSQVCGVQDGKACWLRVKRAENLGWVRVGMGRAGGFRIGCRVGLLPFA